MIEEKQINNEIYPCQSFYNNIAINSNTQSNIKCPKDELMNFSFKKIIDIKLNDITKNKEQKYNNIYSKNDKNINKSGHFGNTNNSNNNKSIKLPSNQKKSLIKTLFKSNKIKNIIKNNNKENIDTNNNIIDKYFNHYDTYRTNFCEKNKIKTKKIIPIKSDKNNNFIQNRTTILNKKLLIDKSSSKTNKINDIKKKIIKPNGHKLLISSYHNSIFKTKNIKPRNKIKTKDNNNSFINKSFDLTEKKIIDSLFNKINHINKKINLFSEYTKKLKQQIKTLNNALSNSELNNSKKIFKNDKNNRSYKLITISPHKNKESVHSNIKSILFKRKIKTSNNVKKKNYLNNLNKSYNKRNKYSESYKNITEFNIEEKKYLNIKNKNINNYNYEKSIKKRRVKTDSLFECIHIPDINKFH